MSRVTLKTKELQDVGGTPSTIPAQKVQYEFG